MDRPILLKLSGEAFSQDVQSIVKDIKALDRKLGIVVGGGNFFRGDRQGRALKLPASTGHEIGMLATLMNGLILQSMLEDSVLFSAIECKLAKPITQSAIDEALATKKYLIFAGGTGNPFFTTDTSAILRALQIGASEVWKATNVDGVYDSDPNINKDANILRQITYKEALEKQIGVMDLTAMTLACEHDLTIRVFNMLKLSDLNNGIGSKLSN